MSDNKQGNDAAGGAAGADAQVSGADAQASGAVGGAGGLAGANGPAVNPLSSEPGAAGFAVPPPPAPLPKTGAPKAPASKKPSSGVRKVHLSLTRIDPLSVMKLSFLLSVAIGIMLVIAVAVFWTVLDKMHVFAQIDTFVRTIMEGSSNPIDVLEYVSFGRVISAATLIAVFDVFVITALSTIFALLYNVTAALVGGLHLTLADE